VWIALSRDHRRPYTNRSRNSRPTILTARCRLSIVALPVVGVQQAVDLGAAGFHQ
jgi:hypothetical protein